MRQTDSRGVAPKISPKLTSVESTADCHHDDLDGQQPAQTKEDWARLVVDGVHAHDVDDRAGRDENSGADRLEEEEALALLDGRWKYLTGLKR